MKTKYNNNAFRERLRVIAADADPPSIICSRKRRQLRKTYLISRKFQFFRVYKKGRNSQYHLSGPRATA